MRQWEREVNSTTAQTAGMRPRLARTLTLSHAVLYGLGVTIGAGIYVLVSVAAGRAGMHAPLAFRRSHGLERGLVCRTRHANARQRK